MTPKDRLFFRDALTDPEAEGLTAYAEARNQTVRGIIGVINSIRNRAVIKKTRSSYQALATAAYSCWLDDASSTNDNELEVLARAILAGRPTGYNPVLDICLQLASRKDLQDEILHATHYFNYKTTVAPYWTKQDAAHHPVRTCVIGDHEFWTRVLF